MKRPNEYWGWKGDAAMVRNALLLLCTIMVFSGVSFARTWSDDTGKHQVEAAFVGCDGGRVDLLRYDTGAVVSVPVQRLSDVDRRFLFQLRAVPESFQRAYSQNGKRKAEEVGTLTQRLDDAKADLRRAQLGRVLRRSREPIQERTSASGTLYYRFGNTDAKEAAIKKRKAKVEGCSYNMMFRRYAD